MPGERARWRDRIHSVELECSALRVSVAWMLNASDDEIHEVIDDEEGLDDPHWGAARQAKENLSATYFIRMFSMFEMAIKTYWRSRPGNASLSLDLFDAINFVSHDLHVPDDLVEQAHRVRNLRNDLVHDWNRARVTSVNLSAEKPHMLAFLDRLPLNWS